MVGPQLTGCAYPAIVDGTMTTPTLPPAGARTPTDHRAIAMRFLDHAQLELDKGHRLQAGEKAWGGVAHQLKAIARARGWDSVGHANLYAVADYLAREYGTPEGREPLPLRVTTIDGFHRNFYENERSTDSIQAAIGSARRLVDDLEEMRQKEPQPFTIENESDQRTVTMLTGVEYPLEETREEGFVNIPRPDRPAHPRGRRRRRDPGDYRTGGSATRAGPPPTSGAPAAALPMPAPENTTSQVMRPEQQHSAQIRVDKPSGKLSGQRAPYPFAIDIGATVLLEEPKQDGIGNILSGHVPKGKRARPVAVKTRRSKKSGRVRSGQQRLPSGRTDRR